MSFNTTGTIKVLIVEDNEGALDFWRSCFSEQPWSELGLRFLWAATLREAEVVFSSNPDIALVVMDYKLEKPDGSAETTLKLVQWIREQGFTGPMIATSSDSGRQEKLKRVGCTHESDKGRLPWELLKVLGL